MLKYIRTPKLLVNNDFEIKKGDIISNESLCASLKHRSDFEEIESTTEESEWEDENIPKYKGKKINA